MEIIGCWLGLGTIKKSENLNFYSFDDAMEAKLGIGNGRKRTSKKPKIYLKIKNRSQKFHTNSHLNLNPQ